MGLPLGYLTLFSSQVQRPSFLISHEISFISLILLQEAFSCQRHYQVKVFNQSSKRKPCIVRQLHNFTGQFESIKHLHQVLQSEMTGSLPPHYVIGYYEGRHHTKRWLTSDEDLTVMNKKFCNGNISMWCDAREASDEDSSPSRDQERS